MLLHEDLKKRVVHYLLKPTIKEKIKFMIPYVANFVVISNFI